MGAQASAPNPSTARLYITSKCSHLCKLSLFCRCRVNVCSEPCGLSACTCLPARFPSRAGASQGRGISQRTRALDPAPAETSALQESNLCELLPSSGWPPGRVGCSLRRWQPEKCLSLNGRGFNVPPS